MLYRGFSRFCWLTFNKFPFKVDERCHLFRYGSLASRQNEELHRSSIQVSYLRFLARCAQESHKSTTAIVLSKQRKCDQGRETDQVARTSSSLRSTYLQGNHADIYRSYLVPTSTCNSMKTSTRSHQSQKRSSLASK